jgi:outer membrane murein-binding lipoprotein Lpp
MAQLPAQPPRKSGDAAKRPVTAMVHRNPKATVSHKAAAPKTAKEINDILHGLILAGKANTKEFDEWQTALYRLPRQSANWWERLNATAKQLEAADEDVAQDNKDDADDDEGEDDDEEEDEEEEGEEEEEDGDNEDEEEESPCASECEEDDDAGV